MDAERYDFTKDQISRIEKLCQGIANVSDSSRPTLLIAQWVENNQWGMKLSISIGSSTATRRNNVFTTAPYPPMEFTAISKPWSTWQSENSTPEQAFCVLCERVKETAQNEIVNIDREITHLRDRRVQLERALDAFAASGGTHR